MKCEVIQDLLPMYIDERTSAESNELLSDHLQTCKACSDRLYDMKNEISNAVMNIPRNAKNESIQKFRFKGRLGTVMVTLLVTFSLLGIFLTIFGNTLFQEGNPIPVISGIIKLEFSDKEYIEIGTDRYISEAGENRYAVVQTYMNENGWEFAEQMGSGLIFEKGEEQTIVDTRQYTKNYYVWTVPPQDTKEG